MDSKTLYLHRAVSDGNEKLVREILTKCGKKEVNVQNKQKETALHIAADIDDKRASLNLIKCLIHGGVDFRVKDYNGCTFLHRLLSKKGSLTSSQFHEVVQYLADKSCIHAFNVKGGQCLTSPLQLAVWSLEVKEETLCILNSQCADFNSADRYGLSVLGYAVEGGRSVDLLLNLIKFGANPAHLTLERESLLHIAAIRGNSIHLWETTKALSEKGVNINGVDAGGKSVLFFAAAGNRSADYLRYLIKFGADWTHLDYRNCSILHHAATFCSLEALKFLLELPGLDVNATDDWGTTPLHRAVHLKRIENMIERVTLLAKCGGQVAAKTKSGLTPLIIGLSVGHSDQLQTQLKTLL